MSRPGVSHGGDARPLGDAALPQGSAEGVLHTRSGPGPGRCGHTRSPTSRSWEDPERMAMGDPGLASPLQEAAGQGNVAVLGPFAQADVEAHASRVKIAHLQMRPVLQAQTASLDRGEADAVARQLHAGEDGTHLRRAQNDRECLRPGRPHECQGCPFALQGV
jgi:hypothetical protein